MKIVEVFVAADGIHVGVKSVAGRDTVGRQFHPFPFGERVDDFCPPFAHAVDGEADGAFHPVQVVVDAGSRENE